LRPTVSEQLAGMRRILVEVVAPEVHGAYPADMLRGIVANLEMLESSWARVAPFLAWDNAETTRVLRDVQTCVDGTLAPRIQAALGEPEPDPLAADALEARNTQLRELLAEAIPLLASGGPGCDEPYTAVRTHLRDRIERFPLTLSAPMPGTKR